MRDSATYREDRGVLVDGYVRVSQVGGRSGDRFISPAVQREQIEAWAKTNGSMVGEIFEELDESGARTDRPLLLQALERVESGESQGIVVAKLDRFGRSLIDGLGHIERIRIAGGTFVSVQDGLDLNTATGNLVLRIMFSMAEWELDRVRSNWETARQRAVANGIHLCGGRPPVGYQRGPDRRMHPHPKNGPVIGELFGRRAAGESLGSLCRWLDAQIETPVKRHWVRVSLRAVLRNRVYLGEARSGPHVKLGAHPALVDPATWQRAQSPRRVVPNKATTLLGGLIRCASCRHVMRSSREKLRHHSIRYYACKGDSSTGRCPAQARIRADVIEPAVEELFFRLIAKPRRDYGAELAKAEAAVAETEVDLASFRDDPRPLRALGYEHFEAGLIARRQCLDTALLHLSNVRRAAKQERLSDAAGVERRWSQLTIAQRRTLLEAEIDCLFVTAGPEPGIERVHVCLSGKEPVELPRRGRAIKGPIRPFVPRRSTGTIRPPKARRWSERRIREGLVELVGDRPAWPTYEDFATAGHLRLYYQVMRWGGPYWWARQLGLTEVGERLVHVWDEDHIRAALGPFLNGRTGWPRPAEFDAAGLSRVHRKLKDTGGVARWAAEFGLARPDKRRGATVYWTDQRIEEALRLFTAGRTTYPSRREFAAGDRANLYAIIESKRELGHQYWANRLGIRRQRTRRNSNSPDSD